MSSPTAYRIVAAMVLITGMSIIGASISIGYASRELTVTENPYADGLRFDEVNKLRESLGWHVIVPQTVMSGGQLKIEVRGKNSEAIENADVDFHLARMGAMETAKYRAEPAGDGVYAARLNRSDSGYWDMDIKVTLNGNQLEFKNIIKIIKE